jgi:predicted metalloprotease with PDZ domain
MFSLMNAAISNFLSRLRRRALRPEAIWVLWIICGLFLSPLARAQQRASHLTYELSIANLAQQRFRVRLNILAPPAQKLAFRIPTWTPGYYQLIPYEKNLILKGAQDSQGNALKVEVSPENLWEIDTLHQPEAVTLTYEVIAKDDGLGFFGSRLDTKRGYINGASAFVYPVDFKESPITLRLKLPEGWKVATGLNPVASPDSFTYSASNYDELIDAPIQMGLFRECRFTVSNTPFRVVVVGRALGDETALIKPLAAVAREMERIFGGFPFARYLFLYHFGGGGFFGGLEHQNSTIIHLDKLAPTSDDFLTISTHELFHAWNVKRLRPVGLGPFDYTQAVRSPSVWFSEGVTDYYALLIPVRAGLRSPEWFYKQMAERIDALDSNRERRAISLEESSLKVWDGDVSGYKVDYYNKGSLVGFYFDLRIRALTEGRRSLDDVLRLLDSRYGAKNIGFPPDAILQALNDVGETDFTAEYRRYVSGTEDIAWELPLAAAGIRLEREARPLLGISLEPDNKESVTQHNQPARVQAVFPGFAGEKMGVRVGDRLLRMNGIPINSVHFALLHDNLTPGGSVKLDVLRDGQTLLLTGTCDVQYARASLSARADSALSARAAKVRTTLFAPTRPASALPASATRGGAR